MTAQHETALFTEQFRYDARGRTTAQMQSFGAGTGAVAHSRVWGIDYDERGHVARLSDARGVLASEWATIFATTAALPNGAASVADLAGDVDQVLRFSDHAFQVSSLGTLLGETALTASGSWPTASSWTPTRAEGAIMPSVVNGAGIAWDALGRMESHDGLTIDDWSFDHRLLQVTQAAEGSEPAASERYIYDIHGRPVVLDILDAAGFPVERVFRTWWGDRLIQEQGGGFVRTWWQGLADALPFAYTVSIIPASSGGGSGVGGNSGENPPAVSAYTSWLAADDLTFAAVGDHALVEGAEWESTFMLLRNHRGDTVTVVEPNGSFREVYVYGLWGDSTVVGCTTTSGGGPATNTCTIPKSNSTLGNSSQFAGTHRSPLTNLHHMGARWYSAALRQFISRDPLGQAVSFDEWLYTVGDPMNFVDRSGLSPAGVRAGRHEQCAA